MTAGPLRGLGHAALKIWTEEIKIYGWITDQMKSGSCPAQERGTSILQRSAFPLHRRCSFITQFSHGGVSLGWRSFVWPGFRASAESLCLQGDPEEARNQGGRVGISKNHLPHCSLSTSKIKALPYTAAKHLLCFHRAGASPSPKARRSTSVFIPQHRPEWR